MTGRVTRRRLGWRSGLLALLAPWILFGADANAENAWVKDDLRLNLRTGPGTEFRIIGVMKTGDAAAIMARSDGWTQVRVSELGEGWIPAGYLQPEPPARIGLAQREVEVETLRQQLEELTQEAEELRQANTGLASQETARSAELARLTRENLAFRAGARWPEWFAGAGILGTGMIVGAIMSRATGRRRPARVRL